MKMAEEKKIKAIEAVRLDDFLRTELTVFLKKDATQNSVSKGKIRRLIFSGNVFVKNGQGRQEECTRNPSLLLKRGQTVRVLFDREKFFYEKPSDDIDFELDDSRVIYEDEYIIVVNKPPHFPTESTFVQSRDNLHAAVVRYLHKKAGLDRNAPYAGIMHRLDRDTSGVILFSKQRSVNAALHAAFESPAALEENALFSESDDALGSDDALENGDALPAARAANSDGRTVDSRGRAAKKIYLAVCTKTGAARDFRHKSRPVPRQRPAPPPNSWSESRPESWPNSWPNSWTMQNYIGRISPKSEAAKWGALDKAVGGKFAKSEFKILKEKGGLYLIECVLFTGRTHQLRVHLSESGFPVLGDVLYGGESAGRIFLHSHSLELPHPVSLVPMKFEAPFSDCPLYQER